MTMKINALRFQISKMANADADNSMSLLESPNSKPVMSQEVNDDGVTVFKCTTCNMSYKQLKRLQTHLKKVHNISIDLDETVTSGNFSPKMFSTCEDAVQPSPKQESKDSKLVDYTDMVESEKEKPKTGVKRERETSDDEGELHAYRMEKEKRAKVLEELEHQFDDNDMSDLTLNAALNKAEENDPSPTQAMTEKLSQAIADAEGKIHELEKQNLDDSIEKDDKEIKTSLQKQLELKNNLLNCKEEQIITLYEQIAEKEKQISEKDKTIESLGKSIQNKKLLIKEKEKELGEVMKKAKNITKAAGKSPSKENLKEKCLKHERSIQNLQGRLKNVMESNSKDNPAIAKLEQTVDRQIKEIEHMRETMAVFEAREAKFKRKIPCGDTPCKLGRKDCPYSHDLEYKKPVERGNKQYLCKYFAGTGCNLDESQCRFSHSLELLAKSEAKAATGANQMPLGSRGQFSSEDLNRVRKVSQGANNNMSVEIVDDLSGFPANDARRTLLMNRTKDERDMPAPELHNSRQGNGQGTSYPRSHIGVPREDQRPHRQTTHPGYYSDRRHQDNYRQQGDYQRRDYDREERRQYDRDQPQGSFNRSKRPRY